MKQGLWNRYEIDWWLTVCSLLLFEARGHITDFTNEVRP